MGIGVKRKEVENVIMEILQTNIPEVEWIKIFKGFQRGKEIVGSVVCSSIATEYDAKNQRVATSTYDIILSDSENLNTVDNIADMVDELLDNDDLNGTVTIGEIKEIRYMAAPNKADAGAAWLVYEVKYYV